MHFERTRSKLTQESWLGTTHNELHVSKTRPNVVEYIG